MPLPVTDPGSDASLVTAARRGDGDAIGLLFERHGTVLYQAAYRLLGSRADAEDVVQDVFVGLPTALARYEEHGALAAWLRRVTIRVALMRLRSSRREVSSADAAGAAVPGSGTDDRLALRSALDTALRVLSPPLRAVFMLREVEGYSHEEIAGLLGISLSASRVRHHRAVRLLQAHLKELL